MADDRVEVEYVLVEKSYIDGLKKIQKESGKTSKDIVNDNKKSSLSWKNMGLKAKLGIGVAFAAITKIVIELKKASDEAALYAREMRGLNEVAKAFGEDGGAAKKVAKGIEEMSGGMVSATQAAQGLKFLLSSGYSLEKASTMSEALLNVGSFNRVVDDLGQAFVDSAKGIKTGSIELIENIGFTEKLSGVMKRAGINIKDGIDITNNAEQSQALYNAVLEQGTLFAGNLDEAVKGYDKTMAEFGLTIDKVTRKIGEKFSPIIEKITVGMTSFLKKFIEDAPTASEKLEPLITKMGELQLVVNPTAEETEALKETMNEISILSPEMVESYDKQSNAIINLSTATRELIKIKELELKDRLSTLEIESISEELLLEKSNKKKIKITEKYNKKMENLQNTLTRLKNELEVAETKPGNDWADYIRQRKDFIKQTEEDMKVSKTKFHTDNRAFFAEHENLETSKELREANIESVKRQIEKLGELDKIENATLTDYKGSIKGEIELDSNFKSINIQDKMREELAKGEPITLIPEQDQKLEYTKTLNELIYEEMKKGQEEQNKLAKDALEEQNKLAKDALELADRNTAEENALKTHKFENEKEREREEDKKSKENFEKALEDRYKINKVENDRLTLLEETRLSAKKGLALAETKLTSDLVSGQKASLGEYANVIAQQLEITLTSIAVESGIKALWETAQGLANMAIGRGVTANIHFKAAAGFGGLAAKAGLGATAAHAAVGATETNAVVEATETPSKTPLNDDDDDDNVAVGISEDIVYMSKSDWQRMTDSINEAAAGATEIPLNDEAGVIGREVTANILKATAEFGAVAAAAGLGATAANAAVGYPETPSNDEADNVAIVASEDIENEQPVYISKSDWQRMAFANVDSINEALLQGKSLKVRK